MLVFFFHFPSTSDFYSLSLHDALPILSVDFRCCARMNMILSPSTISPFSSTAIMRSPRSEEHTSELQSRGHLVCRLLLEKKKESKLRVGSIVLIDVNN